MTKFGESGILPLNNKTIEEINNKTIEEIYCCEPGLC